MPRTCGDCAGIGGHLTDASPLWYSSSMFKVDMEEIKQMESDLETFTKRAYPIASKTMLNNTAFEARERIQAGIRKKFIIRNKFTVGSVRVEKARGNRVKDHEAVVGSVAPYMEDQEFGGTKVKRGKHGVSIPTTSASGEGRGTRPRRRVATSRSKKRNITLSKIRVKAKSKGAEAHARVMHAAENKQRFVFLDLSKHPGIYKVTGGKKNPKIDLVHDMSRKSVQIPRTGIILTATRAVEKTMPEKYRKALIFQMKRHDLFKG